MIYITFQEKLYSIIKDRAICSSIWSFCFDIRQSIVLKYPTLDLFKLDDWLVLNYSECKDTNSLIDNLTIAFGEIKAQQLKTILI